MSDEPNAHPLPPPKRPWCHICGVDVEHVCCRHCSTTLIVGPFVDAITDILLAYILCHHPESMDAVIGILLAYNPCAEYHEGELRR
jgi:hypothetical protein